MAKKKAGDDQPKKTNGDGPSRQPEERPETAPATPGAARAASQAQLAVLAQYIKDLSFENSGRAAIAAGARDRTLSSRSASM